MRWVMAFPTMLCWADYAQFCTYSCIMHFNMLKILLIMPQICLLCSRRSKLVCSSNYITLLHTSQLHHQPQTTYIGGHTERSTSRLHGPCTLPLTITEDSITGPQGPGHAWDTVWDWDTETRRGLRSQPQTLCSMRWWDSRVYWWQWRSL